MRAVASAVLNAGRLTGAPGLGGLGKYVGVPDDQVSSGEEVSAATSPRWRWDPSLYAGSARFYPIGRVEYPQDMVLALVDALSLDGCGTLIDVGCGPGSLTLPLAPHVDHAIGIDADADMLAEGARLAQERGIANVSWRQMFAEDLPADLSPVSVVTFAQSFHWFDRPRVAAAVRGLLQARGAAVHVHASTTQGIDGETELSRPRPPWERVGELVRRYLGPQRRAGQGVLVAGDHVEEATIYRAAGFSGPQRIEISGRVVERTVDEVVASVFSVSGSAPHLFGNHLDRFEAELRALLAPVAADGRFCEQMPAIIVDIWR